MPQMEALLDIVYRDRSKWDDSIRKEISDALQARYLRLKDVSDRRNDERKFQLRLNSQTAEGSVPYVALIPGDQDTSGPYGGMSFVIFPADEDGKPGLIAMGVGTNGIAPDEEILARQGHARKCAAITTWARALGIGIHAWSKRDPVRVDMELPDAVDSWLESWRGPAETYGKVLYSIVIPPDTPSSSQKSELSRVISAYVDLFFQERNVGVKKDSAKESADIMSSWQRSMFPAVSASEVHDLLKARRFVIVEGPPGTGKTRLALQLLKEQFGDRGRVIQFHPGTTYESFIGGLAPHEGGAMGFTFKPQLGSLGEAIAQASKDPEHEYLLIVDEINRADLSKVLGEAIMLLEPDEEPRTVKLPYVFEETGAKLTLPRNLFILGTMNSADRSIAILDVAVRRRFAFVTLWPQADVVEQYAKGDLRQAFYDLQRIFIEHATDDSLALLPGHSYFMGSEADASMRLRTGLRPLLQEYLAQGYVAGFSDEIRAYLDMMA
jgi:5-methylcytosine-specific restriction enzyme B